MGDLISSLRQKQSNGFSDKINFNIDSNSIHMLSGLTLEKELLLGRKEEVSITEQNGVTVIKEWPNRTNGGDWSVDYVYTMIKTSDENTIIAKLVVNFQDASSNAKVTLIENTNQTHIQEWYIDTESFIEIANKWGVDLV